MPMGAAEGVFFCSWTDGGGFGAVALTDEAGDLVQFSEHVHHVAHRADGVGGEPLEHPVHHAGNLQE